tara:strand:+ start:212 stop:361 length:150 start_codon:yes stop_codon:yes gene_type:complete
VGQGGEVAQLFKAAGGSGLGDGVIELTAVGKAKSFLKVSRALRYRDRES